MAEETEVDAPVEDQTSAASAALTMVIADTIMSQGDQASENSSFWVPLLLSGPKAVLLQYLISTTNAMWSSAPAPVIRRHSETAADASLRRAAEIVAEGVPEMHLPHTTLAPSSPSESGSALRAEEVRQTAGKAARAAIVGGRESARFDVAKEVGAVYKVWRTRMDDRVRPTHGGLEGNRVPLNGKFITFEGHGLRFPRDPLAPLSETAECRCRCSYIIKE